MKSKWFCIGLVNLFLVVSFLFISPASPNARSQIHSNQLQRVVVRDGDTERRDFVDSNGRITVAADQGYATMTVTETGNGRLVQYFDDSGEPVSSHTGYYAMLQEYDDTDNKTRITYLNSDGDPMIMAGGYASEIREYDDNGRIISARYLDLDGNPIRTPSFGYGKINEYDENGKVSRITYINAFGAPMTTGLGYASIIQNYYDSDGPDNGRVESELYFDADGNPVCLSLGQYGVHKEYDEYGRVSVLTYLDETGEPIVTKKGYAKIVRTFHTDNSVATERYYDLEGNPFSLSEGQYGVKKDGEQTVYLNQDGKEIFNLKNLLYNHSWVIIPAAMILIILSGVTGKNWNIILLILYLFVIGYLTIMFREEIQIKGPGFFRPFEKFFTDSEIRSDIIKNIWLFIPLGTILYRLCPKKSILLIPAALSILIEGIQYFTGTGFCELSDIISNALGSAAGFAAGCLIQIIRNETSWKYSSVHGGII